MKILVTGSNGLIGSGLCKYLLEKGHEVKGIDLSEGYDLADEKMNDTMFKENYQYNRLINLFAINDHVEKSKKGENSSILNYEVENLRTFCEINIIALFNTCRNFIRYSKSPKSIINLASLYGLVSPKHHIYNEPKDIGYTISKHAVIGMSRHMATYFAKQELRINCVVPGGILFNQPKEFVDEYSRNTPMKRMMNKHEIYPLLEFLSSDDASYITGSVYTIDGGWTAW